MRMYVGGGGSLSRGPTPSPLYLNKYLSRIVAGKTAEGKTAVAEMEDVGTCR